MKIIVNLIMWATETHTNNSTCGGNVEQFCGLNYNSEFLNYILLHSPDYRLISECKIKSQHECEN